MKVTNNRLVFLRELKDGPRTWKDLRLAYYGPERAKNPASTSFMNQIKKLVSFGVLNHIDGHYELTEKGKTLLVEANQEALMAAKTVAQLKAEHQEVK
jgi:predicted transcriptional regulator